MDDARPIIECAEVFPKRPSQKDLGFDILWSELSSKPNGGSGTKFRVQLDLLRQLAKKLFPKDTSLKQRYRNNEVDYPAAPDTPTTSHTSSQDSSSSSSESSYSADPSYEA